MLVFKKIREGISRFLPVSMIAACLRFRQIPTSVYIVALCAAMLKRNRGLTGLWSLNSGG